MSAGSILGLAGSYFFGPVGGFIGSTLGGLLDRPDDITNYGPRLQDRKVTTTGYGQTLPIIYGTMQVAGSIIEPKNFELDETRHKSESSGGKGGPTVTNVSYTYSATFAVAICEGPIIGVRKIWLDSELVYDFSNGATAEAIVGSNAAADGIRIYTGSESQAADSILEGINGAGNTPAYRGTAYIVFDNLQLQKYGNRVPNIRVEVVGSGSSVLAGKIAEDAAHDTNYGNMVITDFDNGVFRIWDKTETTLLDFGVVYLVDTNCNYLGQEYTPIEILRRTTQDNYPVNLAGKDEIGTLGTGENSYYVYQGNRGNLPESGGGPLYLSALYAGAHADDVAVRNFSLDLAADRYVIGIAISADHNRMLVLMGEVGVAAGTTSATGLWYLYDQNTDLIDTGTCDYSGHSSGGASSSEFGYGNVSQDTSLGMCMMESDYEHVWSGKTSALDVWKFNGNSFEFYIRQTDTTSVGSSSGKLPSIYADKGAAFIAGRNAPNTGGYVTTFSRQSLFTISSATLSDIVDDIEERSGIIAADRDNTALTDSVDGYMISRQTQARRAIEPLQTAFFFDTIESDYQLKSVKRGGASVATIASTSMGAIEYGSEAVYPLQKTRAQEIELPIEVTCQYIDPDRGYEVGVQRSRRIETQSSEKKNISLPISMTDNKGKQIVEVLHFNFWAERNSYVFSLMPQYTYLDPSDVITVTDDGVTHTIRIVSMNMTPGGVIQCEGVAERPALYTSTSTGADNSANAVNVTQIGPTKAIYGDWPMFTNGQDSEGLYVAAAGFLAGWRGAVIYRSNDEGASYTQAAAITGAATIGTATEILADGSLSTFDYANTLNVNIISETLSSSTELGVLNGDNAMMVGSELIQFVTATLESDGTYTLSTLLRGRKGTEWAMSEHVAGEQVALIDYDIIRTPASLNVSRKYKAVSIGNFLADSYPVDVTYTGVNLKPYAPVHVEGVRDSTGDIDLNWTRRSRFETSPFWSPAVGEESEEYEVDIYTDGTYTTIKRAITGLTSPTYTYTAALQTTDFGSTQSTIYVKIYQKSATIGRGYAASEAA